MRYYIWKTNEKTSVTRYWNRRAQNWSKWFDSDCYYPTQLGVRRVYMQRIKNMQEHETIGWHSMFLIRKENSQQ